MKSIIKSQTQTIAELQALVTRLDPVWTLAGCLKSGKMVFTRDKERGKKGVIQFLVEPTQKDLTEIGEW